MVASGMLSWFLRNAFRDWPRSYSSTMYAVLFASKKRATRTMLRWRKVASVRASTRKSVQPALVELLVEVIARGDGVVLRAIGELLGQVLLDHHLGREIHVGGGIRYAESALPSTASMRYSSKR